MELSLKKSLALFTAAALAAVFPAAAVPAATMPAAAVPEADSVPEAPAARPEYSPARLGEAEITVFAAKSLNNVMETLIESYHTFQPGVKVLGNYDSSGTLMTQIEEGAPCDLFFSAAQKQMDQLEEEGLLIDGSRFNAVNNRVCVVTYDGSGTSVTGLATLGDASSLALADGSVPVGKYTREALAALGMLPEAEDVSLITTKEISEALGGVEINECANVGAVTSAVAEGANEVGTVYYSDTRGLEDRLVILEEVPYELTGDVIYPVALTVNKEADDAETAAAYDFASWLASAQAQAIFESYYFDTDV